MPQVKIEEIVDHLSYEIQRALEEAVHQTIPDSKFNSNMLFRNFVRAVGRKCSTWERVPDRYVKE